ncbi:VOC family protein [Pseudaestuariivita sp.]|uniref:VOC family protein n=1 Tax=Pseudaestuariivita sp. TaxID=2211669 RepID=UPI004059F695
MGYVTVGSNDMAASERFYAAVLPALGYTSERYQGDLSYLPPAALGPAAPHFYVKAPFDGKDASAGNGAMVAFEAPSQTLVRDLHATGLAAGGTDEGAPGFRAAYSANFFVAYLRDPSGNKIALFTTSDA